MSLYYFYHSGVCFLGFWCLCLKTSDPVVDMGLVTYDIGPTHL